MKRPPAPPPFVEDLCEEDDTLPWHILVAVDGGELDDPVLDHARLLARRQNATVCVVHVCPGGHAPDVLDRARERLRLAHARFVLRPAERRPIGEVIAQEADRQVADLVVMGANGRVAEELLRLSCVPVTLVRRPFGVREAGDETPGGAVRVRALA